MISGTSKNGFRFKLDDSALDDLELLERINEVDSNPSVLPDLLKDFLGLNQYEKLKESVRGADGKVKISAIAEEFASILESAGKANKNAKN